MRFPLLVLATVALLPLAAIAQTPKPEQALSIAEQEDLRFEESIRNFGFVSGAAHQCLPEADRTAHDREVLTAFSGLVRLFGSDRAFFYAAAFGAGTSRWQTPQPTRPELSAVGSGWLMASPPSGPRPRAGRARPSLRPGRT